VKRIAAITISIILLSFFAVELGFGLSSVVSQYVMIVEVDGDSMEPTIEDASIAVVCGWCEVDEGDVIAFESEDGQIVVHRADIYVEYDDDWVEQADEEYISDIHTTCASMSECPSDQYGWITVGDGNEVYDQAGDNSMRVVSDSDVEGQVVYVF